jgi:thiol peroxidase
MADITLKGNSIHTSGDLPAVGTPAPEFELVGMDLSTSTLQSHSGYRILNIFPSLDTGVCALSVKAFNAKAAGTAGVTVLNVSGDLPFAHKRFCANEGLENVVGLSSFRSSFADDFGLRITDGPLKGLCSRCVVVVAPDGTVAYTEQVPEITTEPNYDAALAAAN